MQRDGDVHGDFVGMKDIGKNSEVFYWCNVCKKLAIYSIQYEHFFFYFKHTPLPLNILVSPYFSSQACIIKKCILSGCVGTAREWFMRVVQRNFPRKFVPKNLVAK